MKRMMGKVGLVVAVGCLAVLGSGCASMLANQVVQARHPARKAAIQAARVEGGAGIGISLFDLGSIQSGSDVAIQGAGAVVDAALLIGAYRLYERANSSADSTPQIPNITTGNNSPVQIRYGNGPTGQNNPNNPTTITTTTGM